MKKISIFIFIFSFIFSAALIAQASVITTKTSRDVYSIFSRALGGKVGLLNANNKSGQQGAADYINTYISTTTINSAVNPVITDTSVGPREKMDWFKAKFLENTAGNLNDRDKEGIKQAMVARYKEFCFAEFKKSASTTAWQIYSEKVKNLVKARKTEIDKCMSTLGACADSASAGGSIAVELCKIQKDTCVSAAYVKYQTDLLAAYNLVYSTAASTLDTCLKHDRVTKWW